ncbi:acyloxyacyl hydrolase [Devosia soli]|nr:acyloxyacyl hydrolase [Devosia soli]
MSHFVKIAFAIGAMLLAGQAATAQDFRASEVRGGIFAHSADEPGNFFGVFNTERLQDVNVELLFDTPGLTDWVTLGELRPHVGATLNAGGLESMVYAGVSWTVPVFDTPVFVEGTFGGAVHNGNTNGTAIAPARDLGCSVLFRESASIGVQMTENASIMATIEHASNANLCNGNRGLTNMGIRLGWKF